MIIEELQSEENLILDKLDYGTKEVLLKYEDKWGDYFEEETEKGKVRTIFRLYNEQNTRYAVPLVSWLNGLIH